MPLPKCVNMTFEADVEHFWLWLPYDKVRREFRVAMGINMIEREWNQGMKAWRFPTKEFFPIYELIQQFYGYWADVPIFGHMKDYEVRILLETEEVLNDRLANANKPGDTGAKEPLLF